MYFLILGHGHGWGDHTIVSHLLPHLHEPRPTRELRDQIINKGKWNSRSAPRVETEYAATATTTAAKKLWWNKESRLVTSNRKLLCEKFSFFRFYCRHVYCLTFLVSFRPAAIPAYVFFYNPQILDGDAAPHTIIKKCEIRTFCSLILSRTLSRTYGYTVHHIQNKTQQHTTCPCCCWVLAPHSWYITPEQIRP